MPKNTKQRIIDRARPGDGATAASVSGGGTGAAVTPHAHSFSALTGTATTTQVPWAALETVLLTAGNGLTGGGTLEANRTFAVGAGDGITVAANDVSLASTTAGAGLTYTTGVLAVGAGNGITVAADSVALATSTAGAGLTYTTGVLAVGAGDGISVAADAVAVDGTVVRTSRTLTAGDGLTGGGTLAADRTFTLGTPSTLTVNTTNALTSTSHTHAITTSSNPGAAASILQSTSSGGLTLQALAATISVATPLLTTAAGAMNITPVGNLILDPLTVVLDPSGNNVQPLNNYDINLGTINKKYLTLHAAELWVETLVAQNTIATIGGRILVGPTTVLVADVATGDTTITVKHNEMAVGDRVYMEADGKVEFMAIAGGPGGSAGAYIYTVTRNLDGTGANVWYAGDAIFNTGVAGEGFLDIYSVRGVKAATEYGPTIVGNIRLSDTYNDWAPRWAIGNLNGLYDYATTRYGFAAGNPATAWIAADASNGFRTVVGSTTRFQVTSAGNLRINNSAGTNVIALDSDGTSYFAGPMTLGASGGIYQGTGTFGTPTTGLKLWNDTGIGRIGGYNGGTLQWYGSTDGKFYAGAGAVTLSADGIQVAADDTYTDLNSYSFTASGSVIGAIYGLQDPFSNEIRIKTLQTGTLRPWVTLEANGNATYPGYLYLMANSGTSFLSLVLNAANTYSSFTGDVEVDGVLRVYNGSNSLPAYSFYIDPNTGVYRVGADDLGFAANGAQVGGFNTSGLYIPTGYTVSVPYGSAAAPSYTFNTDGNTGMYDVADNNIGFSAGGALAMKLSPTSLMLGSTADSILRLRTPASNSVAVNGTLTINAAFTGIIFMLCPSDSSVAIFGCDSGTAYEISDPEGLWSVTKDTASSNNVYVESGNLIVQNKRASTRLYHIMCFGTSGAFA